jgi:hypothetical protein
VVERRRTRRLGGAVRRLEPGPNAGEWTIPDDELEQLWNAIVNGAESRMALGWPRHEDEPSRYDQLDQELGLLQRAHELRFGTGREWGSL